MKKETILESVIKLIEAKKGASNSAPVPPEKELPKTPATPEVKTPEQKEDRSLALVGELIQKMKNKDKNQ